MNIRVLLVDDEEEFTDVLAERLEARGLEVSNALDGDSALLQLKEKEIDVVILDLEMPGRDGMSTLCEIKRMRPLIQVIMLTGHGTDESANRCFEIGAQGFLTKPTEIKDLIKNIVRAYEFKMEQEGRISQAESQHGIEVENSTGSRVRACSSTINGEEQTGHEPVLKEAMYANDESEGSNGPPGRVCNGF